MEDSPFPAIRFGKNTPEIMALREKEKGDWHNLTLEEKKQCKYEIIASLVRYYFRTLNRLIVSAMAFAPGGYVSD